MTAMERDLLRRAIDARTRELLLAHPLWFPTDLCERCNQPVANPRARFCSHTCRSNWHRRYVKRYDPRGHRWHTKKVPAC